MLDSQHLDNQGLEKQRSDKQKVKDLLHATIYGISAYEMDEVIQVKQADALRIIQELIDEGEDMRSLGADSNSEENVLYSIGNIVL